MGHETSKALRRRLRDPLWAEKIMVGDALDIGAGSDGLGRQIGIWPLLKTVSEWDKQDGDAQLMQGAPDGAFDLVHSSHCLEHVHDPCEALENWYRLVRPGGHLVVVVPDYWMYERGQWPSRFNSDHKSGFVLTMLAMNDVHPTQRGHLYSVADLLSLDGAEILKVERLIAHFSPSLPKDVDQSQGLCEPAIEFIVRKPA